MRRALATSLLAAAGAYVQARRVVEGMDLQYAIQVSGCCGIPAALQHMQFVHGPAFSLGCACIATCRLPACR